MTQEALRLRADEGAGAEMSREQTEGMAVMFGILAGTGLSLALWLPIVAIVAVVGAFWPA